MPEEGRKLIDIHAHILPGVDDGSRNMGETISLLKIAYEQGVRKVIATPHFSLSGSTSSERVLRLLECVQNITKELASDLEIFPGQEILYFDSLAEQLDSGSALTLAGTRYVLIEFPASESFRQMERAIRKLMAFGYRPVIAHAERYTCLRSGSCADAAIGAGALLQMNFTSLRFKASSFWRITEIERCRNMIRRNKIHFLGTDMHRVDYRPPEVQEALSWLEQNVHAESVDRLIWGYPQKLLEEAGVTT